MRESRWSKGKFLDWLHVVGGCPPNDAAAIERATQATLGANLAEFEAHWIEYCKKR